MIPRVFHRIWFGPDAMPKLYETFWAKWQTMHPDWEFKTWDYSNLPHLINHDTFEDCGVKWAATSRYHAGVEQEVMRADIASYDLIAQYGGVYLNCDIEPFQPIDPLLNGVQAFAAWERPQFIGNAIMGAVPQHSFFHTVVANIPDRVNRGWHMERATGPYLITDTYKHHPNSLTLFTAAQLYDGEYAKHHWGHQLEVMGFLGDDVIHTEEGAHLAWR